MWLSCVGGSLNGWIVCFFLVINMYTFVARSVCITRWMAGWSVVEINVFFRRPTCLLPYYTRKIKMSSIKW